MYLLSIEFLNNGDIRGVFSAKADTQGFKLYGIPRDCVQDAINKLDDKLQGIYFLVNTNEKGSGRYLYIGQTKQGPSRLIDHRITKPEWNMAYMFLAAKSELSLQTVDELEALEIQRFTECGKFKMGNGKPNKAEPSQLTRLYSNNMEETLSFFGYDVNPIADQNIEAQSPLPDNIFRIKASGVNGLLEVKEGPKFVLLKGSHTAKEIKEYVTKGTKEEQKRLIKSGVLADDGLFYKTTKDIICKTPSFAGELCTGRSSNGWSEFVNENGQSLGDVLERPINKRGRR